MEVVVTFRNRIPDTHVMVWVSCSHCFFFFVCFLSLDLDIYSSLCSTCYIFLHRFHHRFKALPSIFPITTDLFLLDVCTLLLCTRSRSTQKPRRLPGAVYLLLYPCVNSHSNTSVISCQRQSPFLGRRSTHSTLSDHATI